MGNNINDLKKFIANNIPLKANNINKTKDGIKSVEAKKNEQQQQNENRSNELLEKNTPSEILGRVQVENKKSKKSINDNFENDMALIEKKYKTVSLANNMFDECLNKGYSYHVSSLLAQQFFKEIS